jgi:hypothetical protein
MVSQVKARRMKPRSRSSVMRRGKAVILQQGKRGYCQSKKVDFLILFACSIPSTAAGGVCICHSFISMVFQVESNSKHTESCNYK